MWQKCGKFWYGINGQDVLKCNGMGVVESFCGGVTDFFGTSRDDVIVRKSISRDKRVCDAMMQYPGLRLLKQDTFQCMITFITSTNASIQKIQAGLKMLCRKFGNMVEFDGLEFFLFPEPDILAHASLAEIQKCGIGYRSKYVKHAAQMISDGTINLEDAGKMKYHEARKYLCDIPGVGNKVADCILLFSLEMDEAFPLDRWVLRILQEYYPDFEINTKSITEKQYDIIHDMAVEYFGPHAGHAQQFLFKMERDKHNKKWL
ncbi:MAG: DNA repair protein [Thaumarchaeota archaeon]|nr:DNA repair protein [Nitrososphaerota archaeon]